jgi:hypothetical protein
VHLDHVRAVSFEVAGSSYTTETIRVLLDDTLLGEYRRGWSSSGVDVDDLGNNTFRVTLPVPDDLANGDHDFALRYVSAPRTGTGRPGSGYYIDNLRASSQVPEPACAWQAALAFIAWCQRRRRCR